MEERGESSGVIASRVLRTWGMSESGLADVLGGHIAGARRGDAGLRRRVGGDHRLSGQRDRGDQGPGHRPGRPTRRGRRLLDAEEAEIRRILTEAAGDVVFGVDDEAIEHAVARGPGRRRSDPRTGRVADRRAGLLPAGERAGGQRLVPGGGGVLRLRGEVRRARRCRRDRWSPRRRPRPWRTGARRVLGADVGLSITGVAGPDPQDGRPPGTVFVGLALPGAGDRGHRVHGPR